MIGFMIKEDEHIVFRRSSWHWLVVAAVGVYFLLSLAAFYLIAEVHTQRVQLASWRVAYCQEYERLYAAQHASAQVYLNQALNDCSSEGQ
jgi:hypothetical protein